MILTSPSEDADQAPPVTTTFDPPDHTRPRSADRIDWDRVERLYSFVRTRTLERYQDALRRDDQAVAAEERRRMYALDAMYGQARLSRGVVAACAITFFRARAMRDAHHSDFLGEWLGH